MVLTPFKLVFNGQEGYSMSEGMRLEKHEDYKVPMLSFHQVNWLWGGTGCPKLKKGCSNFKRHRALKVWARECCPLWDGYQEISHYELQYCLKGYSKRLKTVHDFCNTCFGGLEAAFIFLTTIYVDPFSTLCYMRLRLNGLRKCRRTSSSCCASGVIPGHHGQSHLGYHFGTMVFILRIISIIQPLKDQEFLGHCHLIHDEWLEGLINDIWWVNHGKMTLMDPSWHYMDWWLVVMLYLPLCGDFVPLESSEVGSSYVQKMTTLVVIECLLNWCEDIRSARQTL